MKLRTIFSSIVMLLVAQTSLGQTDVTHLIINPDFEDGVTGWKTNGFGPQGNNDFSLKHGKKYAEKWTGHGNKLSDGGIQQTLFDIPAGVYTVTMTGQQIQQGSPNEMQTGGFLFANNRSVEFNQGGDYSVTLTVGDGTLNFGIRLVGSTANWACVDNFRLTVTMNVDSLQPYIRQLIADVEAIDKHITSDEQTRLDEAKNQLSRYVDAHNSDGLDEALQEMKAAMKDYQFSLASAENPFEMTFLVSNANFEDGSKGWIVADMSAQSNNEFKEKSGSGYMERWTSGGYVGNGRVGQLVKGLPSGDYKLSCVGFNIQQSSPTSKQEGAWMFADDKREPIYKAAQYELNFTCVTGEVEIGFIAEGAKGNWIGVDNFRLYYLGSSVATIEEQLKQRIETGEQLTAEYMNSDTLAVLQTTIEQARAVLGSYDVTSEAYALEQAIKAARASIDAYEKLGKAIRSAKLVLSIKTKEKEAMQVVIDTAEATYNNLKSSNEELLAQIPLLERAELVLRIANGFGAKPNVMTHPDVIYGCKAAVGRLNAGNTNVLRQGFCWSKNPEPTIMDSVSTTTYNFNGEIYLIDNLQPSTTYYVRAYVISKTYAIGYGDVVKIITLPEADVQYSYNMAGDDATNDRLDKACSTAVSYLNTWTSIRGFRPSVNYDAGDDGAHGSYGGWITVGALFAQNPGTVMHEMGHGIGVGQHWRYTSWDSPLHPTMYWTGERANRVFAFFENRPGAISDGDRVHVCYGLSGVTAPIDLLRQAAYYQGMYEDGMPAVGDGACPFYSFDCEDTVKYYITNVSYGSATKFLSEMTSGRLTYKAVDAGEAVDDDIYAWNVKYDPTTGLYHIRNVASGKYMTFRSSSFSTISANELTKTEDMHLMPSRQNETIQIGTRQIVVKPYWIACGNRVENPEVLTAKQFGLYPATENLDFYDTATRQHWMLLSEKQMEEIIAAQLETAIKEVDRNEKETSEPTIYDLLGRKIQNENNLKPGVYIIDGKKVMK